MDINAVTGETIKSKRDDNDKDNYGNKKIDSTENVTISLEEAIDKDLKESPGKVEEAELDDDGYYEIEIKTGQNKVEMKIDASSGEMIEKEIERDDD